MVIINIENKIIVSLEFNFIFCLTNVGPIEELKMVAGNDPTEKHAKKTAAISFGYKIKIKYLQTKLLKIIEKEEKKATDRIFFIINCKLYFILFEYKAIDSTIVSKIKMDR